MCAVDRRARDGTTCGSGDLATRKAYKASQESTEEVIDLTSDGRASNSGIGGVSKGTIIGDTIIDLTSDSEASNSNSDVIILDQPNHVAGPPRIAFHWPKAVPHAHAPAPFHLKGNNLKFQKNPHDLLRLPFLDLVPFHPPT